MKKSLLLASAFFLFAVTALEAQLPSKVRFKEKEIKKMSTVLLEKNEQKYPKSYLYRIKKDSITLIAPVKDVKGEKPVFCYKKLSLKDFDKLTVSNREERIKFSLIGGLIFGSLGYVIMRNAAQGDIREQPNIAFLGQRANSGRVEAMLGGLTGFGLGVLIGDLIADRKIDLRRQERQAVKRLKALSYR